MRTRHLLAVPAALLLLNVGFCPVAAAAADVEYTLELDSSADGAADGNALIIEIGSFQWGLQNTLNIGSQSSGAGAGKITFNPFSITKKVDESTPALFSAATTGKVYPLAYFTCRKAGGNQEDVLKLELHDVLIISQAQSGNGDEEPKEQVTFEYGALQIAYNESPPPPKSR